MEGTCLLLSKKLFLMYLSMEFWPSCRRPCFERLPVLVKSVLRAPVPEYALLTTSALSAQTTLSFYRRSGGGLLFLNIRSKSGNMSTRSVSLNIPQSINCRVMTVRARADWTTFVLSRQSMQFVRITEVCSFSSLSPSTIVYLPSITSNKEGELLFCEVAF